MTLDIADYKIESWTIAKGIGDALWILSGQIDKHDVPAFFEKIKAVVQDHNDINHTVFAGIVPGVDYMLAASANKALLTGYDYSWYLSVQYVPSYLRVVDIEQNPSDTVAQLLGEDATQTPPEEWGKNTGIEPYRINDVAAWDTSDNPIKKSFEFGEKCTRWKAIQEICEYCRFVFAVKWNDSLTLQAYFVHEDDIDSDTAGIDIPAMITITNPDTYLLDNITVNDSPEHQYNRVNATGYDSTMQTNLYATAETAEVAAGTELAIEYVYADAALDTQAKTDTRAQELLDFFQASAKVYTARFKQRMDLELYQKIKFVGYQKIDQDEMRITRISYSRSAANDIVEIEFSKDQAIQQLNRLSRAVNPDYVSGQRNLIEDDLSDIGLVDVFTDPISGEIFNPMIEDLDMSGYAINMGGGRIFDLGTPIDSDDATTKAWVESQIACIEIGGAVSNPMTENLDADGFSIINQGTIKFNTDLVHAIIEFDGAANAISFTTNKFYFSIANTIRAALSSTILDLSVDIKMSGYDIDMEGGNLNNLYQAHAHDASGIGLYDHMGAWRGVLSTPNYALQCVNKGIEMTNQKIAGLAAATKSGDALRYEQLIGMYLPLAGGTMNSEGGIDMNWGLLSNVGSLIMRSSSSNIDMNGGKIVDVSEIKGNFNRDIKLWGSNAADNALIEFMRWDHVNEQCTIRGNPIIGVDETHRYLFFGHTSCWIYGGESSISIGPAGTLKWQITSNQLWSQVNYDLSRHKIEGVAWLNFSTDVSKATPGGKEGVLLYDSDDKRMKYHDGTAWRTLAYV